MSLVGAFFYKTGKKIKKTAVPAWRLDESDTPHYTDECSQVVLKPEDWTGARRPDNWWDKPWPPKSVSDLRRAYWNEECIGCKENERCHCDIDDWRYEQKLWEKRIRLQHGERTGVTAIPLLPIEKDDLIGEVTGILKPFENHISPCEHLYQIPVTIGPLVEKPTEKSPQPQAQLRSYEIGSWTNFINHSRRPNVTYREVRYGDQRILVVQALSRIPVGRPITRYWGPNGDKSVVFA